MLTVQNVGLAYDQHIVIANTKKWTKWQASNHLFHK